MDEGTRNQPLRAETDLPTKGLQSKMEGGDTSEVSAAPKRHLDVWQTLAGSEKPKESLIGHEKSW